MLLVLAVAAGAIAGASLLFLQPAAAAVSVVALLTVVGILRYPFFGVIAFVVVATLLPLAVLPIRVVFAPTLIDLVLTTLLLAWIVRVLHRDERLATTHLDLLVLLFLGVAVVALILGMGLSALSDETLRLFLKLVNSTLLFFSVTQVVRTQRQVGVVLRTVLIGGTIAASVSVLLYGLPAEMTLVTLSSLDVVGYPTADVLRPVAGTETLRATGTSVDPNILGGLLMLVGVILVAQGLASKPILSPWLIAAMGLPVAVALALTYSRSAWVGLAAGVTFLAIRRERRAALLLGAAVAAVLVLPQGRAIVGRLGEAYTATDPATVMRLAEYQNAAGIIARYPILGIGFGEAPQVDLAVGVSNLYLLIAEQMGLVGLACFLAIVVAALARSLTTSPSYDSSVFGIHSALEAALVAMLVAGLFDQYFFSLAFPHMVGIFWLIVALLVVTSRHEVRP
jgi:O-antigen ligase